MSAPKQVESIPTVTAPIDLPDLEQRRGWFLANIITGGVLALVAGVLLVVAVVVS